MGGKTLDSFDRASSTYDTTWDADPVGIAQRRRVHALLDEVFPRAGRALDVGCGTGTDARWMADRGLSVVGIDPSAAMIARARRKVPEADFHVTDALPAGPFHAALSNFGALNLAPDLAATAAALAARLVPGAPFVLVLLPRFAPTEWLTLARGDLRTPLRRLRSTAHVGEDEPVPVQFPSSRRVRAAFAEGFGFERQRSLGAVLPRTGSRFGGWAGLLDPLDRRLGSLPLLRRCGDHVAYVFRRR